MEQVRTTNVGASRSAAIPGHPIRMTRSGRPTVIVFDAGPAAWVTAREFPDGLGIGTRLAFHGVTWQVVSYRPHARAYVAEPIAS